jgi:hypothetical protein
MAFMGMTEGQSEKKPCKLYYNLMELKGNHMASAGKRWTVQDRDGNPIYLPEERWQHIVEANNHPEMADYEDHLKTTIQQGRRRQDSITLWELCSLVLMLVPRVRRCRTTLLLQLS